MKIINSNTKIEMFNRARQEWCKEGVWFPPKRQFRTGVQGLALEQTASAGQRTRPPSGGGPNEV